MQLICVSSRRLKIAAPTTPPLYPACVTPLPYHLPPFLTSPPHISLHSLPNAQTWWFFFFVSSACLAFWKQPTCAACEKGSIHPLSFLFSLCMAVSVYLYYKYERYPWNCDLFDFCHIFTHSKSNIQPWLHLNLCWTLLEFKRNPTLISSWAFLFLSALINLMSWWDFDGDPALAFSPPWHFYGGMSLQHLTQRSEEGEVGALQS